MERDEAAKQIHFLQEQLKEREREKERDMRISSEVKFLFEKKFFFNVTNSLSAEIVNTMLLLVITCWLGFP